MQPTDLERVLAQVALVVALAGCVQWIVVYTVVAKWWRSDIGRTLVIKTALLSAVLALDAVGEFAGPSLGPGGLTALAWAMIALVGLIGPVMVWRSVVWLRNRGIRAEVKSPPAD